MSDHAKRRRKVRDWLEANGVDAFLVTRSTNLRYLFGFAGEGIGVIGDRACIATDRRYELDASQAPGRVQVELDPDGHLAGAAAFLKELKVSSVAFEAEDATYATYESLKKRLEKTKLTPTRRVVEKIRAIKDKAEVAAIARAAAIMDEALEAVAAQLRPGLIERDVALDLEVRVRKAETEGIAFDVICAFGPSAAFPHAVPGSRELESGRMVKIDCGAKVDGYCSDITRTYIIGEPDQQLRQVYEAVYEAQRAAVEAAGPGVRCCDLDKVARDIIDARGFGPAFSHSLGHGVGMDVHELPGVNSRNEETLQPGMVVTIEPGIYFEGWGGVRIEDTVVIERKGCRALTRASKQLPDW